MFNFYDPQWAKVDAGGFFNVRLGLRRGGRGLGGSGPFRALGYSNPQPSTPKPP